MSRIAAYGCLLVLGSFFFACSKPEIYEIRYPDGRVESRGPVKKSPDGKLIKHGIWQSFFPDGSVHVEGNYQDNELHGTIIERDRKGNIAAKRGYRLGKKHKKHEVWHRNGKRAEAAEYDNDRQIGVHRRWSRNGQLREEHQFSAGVLQGRSRYFHENGQLESIVNRVNGKIVGEVTGFDAQGRRTHRGSFKDGLKHGFNILYYTDGSTQAIEVFDKGQRDGEWKHFDENGNLRALIQFDHDDDKIRKCFAADGKPANCAGQTDLSPTQDRSGRTGGN